MVNFKDKPASFFKIFFFEFSSKLRIPPEFVKKNREMLPQISLLETESGKSWDVKIKSVNGNFYLTDGWPEFVTDNQLIEKDFLVFHLVSKSSFLVVIYGVEGCRKELSSPHSQNTSSYPCNEGKDAEVLAKFEPKEENYDNGGKMSRVMSFPAVIKKYNIYYMDIPKAFALETGIARKRAIKLQNVEGEEWVVEILIEKDDGRIRMSAGWNKFMQENKLVLRSKCWFEFDATSGNLIVKKECEITNMNFAKRGRGRPPKGIIVPTKKGRGRGRPPKKLAIC